MRVLVSKESVVTRLLGNEIKNLVLSTERLFTRREEDPINRKILEGGSSCFQYSDYIPRVVLVPSARIVLVLRSS